MFKYLPLLVAGVVAQETATPPKAETKTDPVCPKTFQDELEQCLGETDKLQGLLKKTESIQKQAQKDEIDLKTKVAQLTNKLSESESKLTKALSELKSAQASAKAVSEAQAESTGHLTWGASLEWVQNTFSIQQAMVYKLYNLVVKPQHLKMVETNYEKAKVALSTACEKAQVQAHALYEKHVAEHYNKHAKLHVDKVVSQVGEQAQNVKDLYSLKFEDKVENAKVKAQAGFEVAYSKAEDFMMIVPNKVHDALAPKVDVFVAQFPDQQEHIPEALHDRLLLFTAILGLFVVYFILGAKVLGFALRTVFWVLRLAFAIPLFFLTLPCRLCCRKRSAAPQKAKQSFSKPNGVSSNGSANGKSGHGKKKK